MSAKPKELKKPVKLPGADDLEKLAGIIQTWEEHRRVRDIAGGNRQASEAVLEQITGPFTELELIHSLLNAAEMQAADTFTKWRESLNFELREDGSPKNFPVSTGPIYEFYELLRVVMGSGDKELIAAWLAERSWAERILIPFMLKQKADHSIITR